MFPCAKKKSRLQRFYVYDITLSCSMWKKYEMWKKYLFTPKQSIPGKQGLYPFHLSIPRVESVQ